MSLSRKNKVLGVAESLFGRLAQSRRASAREQKPTKLAIDHLEERQLLSLTVATPDSILVNTEWQDIRGNVSVDSNGSGDVVVAWTGADRLINPDYIEGVDLPCEQYLLENADELANLKRKGREDEFVPQYVVDYNVYARYLTDEVQVVSIPAEMIPGYVDADGNEVVAGQFDLVYNAYEVQRLSIYKSNFQIDETTGEEGEENPYALKGSCSYYNLGFYAEGELVWILFEHDANALPTDNAAKLQEQIRALPGGEYSEVVVTAYSETEFDIKFYGEFDGHNVSETKVRSDFNTDIQALINKVEDPSFTPTDLRSVTPFQKLILKEAFGDNYVNAVRDMGVKKASQTLLKLQASQENVICSAVVTTLQEAQSITSYNKRTGAKEGVEISSDINATAKNLQTAFDQASAAAQASLYAPTTRAAHYDEATHRYTYDASATKPNRSDQSYGSGQEAMKAIDVQVTPIDDPTYDGQRFQITFKGSSGLTNQDQLQFSEIYVGVQTDEGTKYKKFDGDVDVVTIKESSAAFRVNAPETTEYRLDSKGEIIYDRYGEPYVLSTGRLSQSKPSVAMSPDGTFVIAWENQVTDAKQPYNDCDIVARRFNVRSYIAEDSADFLNDSVGFYSNGVAKEEGMEVGVLGYTSPKGTVTPDLYAAKTVVDFNDFVQCVYPQAEQFTVNASTNGYQADPVVAGDASGNFIVSWTTYAQENSYFGGIYGRQFNNDAQPLTGDMTFATSQVSTYYFGPSYVAMNDAGFAVVMWNYQKNLYHTVLEPNSDVRIADAEVVGTEGTDVFTYGSSVSFDYNNRYMIAYTSENADDPAGTTKYPATDVYLAAFSIVENDSTDTNNNTTNNNNNGTTNDSTTGSTQSTGANASLGAVLTSEKYTVEPIELSITDPVNYIKAADQGRPSVALDADGDVFLVYQGFGVDTQACDLSSTNLGYLSIDLKYSDFEDNNLVYRDKQFIYDGKYAYEDKNEDLIEYVKLALGWGYDRYGDLVENPKEPAYSPYLGGYSDVDGYIRRFLVIAEKEGATLEQCARLSAVLEALLSPLRNNNVDVNFTAFNQTIYTGDAADPDLVRSHSAVLSSHRDGSNASFFISFPSSWVASASLAYSVVRATDCDYPGVYDDADVADGEVTIDIGSYYTNGFLSDPIGLCNAVADAFNGCALLADDEQAPSFVVRPVYASEQDFYRGSMFDVAGELIPDSFSYMYTNAEGEIDVRQVSDFLILEITAQGTLHDTPLKFAYNQADSTIKFVDQSDTNANYARAGGLYVERSGDLGTSQMNTSISSTGNGDLIVAWTAAPKADSSSLNRQSVYPYIGKPIQMYVDQPTEVRYTQLYIRKLTETTDNAGPVVTNVSLADGQRVENGETITSAIKDIVVSFNENMLTCDGTSYNNMHAVDNPANWSLLYNGVEVP
ncbi:MAG: hypothetical protein HUK22_08900, partial [Thermoguttaceae bacterium]|nr:hypothetical protein [Thermoguttaceae bacterium]